MRPTSTFWPLLALAAIACGRGGDRDVAVTDTASRDLQLAPSDSSARLNDVSLPDTAGAAPVVEAPPPPKPTTTKPKSSTKPATSTAAPKPAGTRTLDAGTQFSASVTDSITSGTNKVGDVVSLKVASDVTNSAGAVVIPAGSTINAKITAIKWSENKSDKGTLKLEPTSVVIGGTSYDIAGTIANPTFAYKKRGSVVGDAAKPAAGAAAGAVVGGLLGKGTGAVIGGVVGGAVGTQRMIETKDRDIVLAPGAVANVELSSAFKR